MGTFAPSDEEICEDILRTNPLYVPADVIGLYREVAGMINPETKTLDAHTRKMAAYVLRRTESEDDDGPDLSR